MSKAERKTICVYCDTWGNGGIETFITETLTHICKKDLAFKITCAEKSESHLTSRLAEADLTVEMLQGKQGISALKKTLRATVPLMRFCQEEQIDILHLNVFHGVSLLQAAAVRMAGVKHVIVHCHGAGLRKSRGGSMKLLAHFIFCRLFSKAATERWAASADAGQFMFPKKAMYTIIPNGIEVECFRFKAAKREEIRSGLQAQGKILLGCVGRLENQKNQIFLLDVLRNLRQRGADALLLLIGDGEDRKRLETEAEKLDLTEHVVFCGFCPNVNEWLWAMDILLIPSISEGLCITAIEGQAAGLPVICSIGVPAEVKVTQAVTFLPVGDCDEWVRVIQTTPRLDRLKQNQLILESKYNIWKSAKLVEQKYRLAVADS